MLKLVAFGALGYLGYKYWQRQSEARRDGQDQVARLAPVAGGPLSENATLQSTPGDPPANDPYGGKSVPIPAG